MKIKKYLRRIRHPFTYRKIESEMINAIMYSVYTDEIWDFLYQENILLKHAREQNENPRD